MNRSLDEKVEERTHAYVTERQQRHSFLSNLTEDLFILAKLEDDEMPFDCMQVALKEVLRNTAKAHSVSAQKENICLTIDADTPCLVWGNKERLERAFKNLAGNAIHHTPEGGSVCITLTLSGELARVAVADSGKGIPQEDMDKIFVKYYTTDSRSL